MRSPSHSKIFVNRSLQMSKIKCVGFDMDATLAIYNSPENEIIVFELIKKFLIKMGYPAEIDQLKYDHSFPVRGIWFDRQLGLLLKTDECSNIMAAWDGLRRMSNQEIREHYPNKHIHHEEERIMIWTTVFHLPEIMLLAGVIDVLNRTVPRLPNHGGYRIANARRLTYHAIQADCRAATDHVHDSGVLKSIITSDLPRYIAGDRRAVDMIRALHSAKKIVFLLTNSPYKFTDAVMSYLMGDKWRELFDVVIVEGNKPNWFTGNATFKEIDITTGCRKLGDHFGPLEKAAVYAGGNAAIFRQQMKCVGKDVLYVGDHIIGDVLVSKQIGGWRTLLIVPELDRELEIWHQHQDKLMEMRKNFIIEEDAYRDPVLAKKRLARVTELTEDMEATYGSMGSTLRCGWRHTHYGGKIRRYADLYTSCAYNLISYPGDHYFHSPMALMTHEELTSVLRQKETDGHEKRSGHAPNSDPNSE